MADGAPDSIPDTTPDSIPDPGQPPSPWRAPAPEPAPEPEPTPEPEPASEPDPASDAWRVEEPPAGRATAKELGPDPGMVERMRFALPAGLGTVLFGAGGVALLGAAQLHALRRSHDETLHAPPALMAQVAGLGLLWVVASIGLVRRAPWGRVLAAFLGPADLVLTLAQAGALGGLPVAGGSPFQRLGIDLLCAALALPWFAPAFRGPEGPATGKAYPAAVAWGTVMFLALSMAPGFATMVKAVSKTGEATLDSPLFRAASALREAPPVAALLLPLLVLGPLLLVELRSRWAAIAVHLVGAATSLLLLNELASVAREVMRRAR